MAVAISATPVDVWPTRVTLAVTGLSASGMSAITGACSTFEGGIGTWAAGTGGSIAGSSAQAHAGTGSLAITSTAGGTMSARLAASGTTATDCVSVTAGCGYTVTAWVRAGTSARSCALQVNWYDAAATYLSTSSVATANDSASAWTSYSGAVTVPVGARYANVILLVYATAAAEVHYLDDVTFVPDTSDVVTVYRSVAGVRTAVRGAGEVTATDVAILALDAELPFGVPITWVASVNDADAATAGPTTYTLTGGKVALSDAITGQSAEVVITAWPGKDRARAATTFVVGGRTVVVSGDRGMATSQVSVLTETDSARENLHALLSDATGGVLQLRQAGPYGGVDCYIAVLSDNESRWSQDGTDARRVWTLTVAEVEAWAPELPTLGFTFDDVDAAYAGLTFADLDGDYAAASFLAFDLTDWS